jgi:glutamate-1-semialdehyde 2,1-aminomutase
MSTKDPVKTSGLSELQREAEKYMPAGVCASARFNPSLGRALYLRSADGCRLFEVDGTEYIDFNLSHGATFLGHNHPATRQAILSALDTGILAGYEIDAHTRLARKMTEIIPCAERVRLGNTGSEGTQVALRLARAFTGKKKLLKFWGHFHGMHDYVMYNAHSPLHPVQPGGYVEVCSESAGMPAELDDLVLVIPWKDEEALERAVREHGHEIAGIIMEPINYNQGCIVATPEYMQLVRDVATANDIVLIYDEVLSAFRTGPGCGQEYYGVTPDVCVIGKAVANGAPIVIIAGKADIMDQVSPTGEVAHSGTFSGNTLAVMAALASVEEITKPGFYDHIYATADALYGGLTELFERAGITAYVQGLGARFGIHFGLSKPVDRFEDTFDEDADMADRFNRACAHRGVYFHGYGKLVTGHHGFSAAHTPEDIDESLNRIETALQDINSGSIV